MSLIGKQLQQLAQARKKLLYFLNKPLLETKTINDSGFGVILIPDHKLIFIRGENCDDNDFNNFIDDFIDDIRFWSKKYKYEELLDRPKIWRKRLTTILNNVTEIDNIIDNEDYFFVNYEDKRNVNLLISLITGSINDINSISISEPKDLLETIKKKIILFDGQQTRFIHRQSSDKVTKIQGLSGTGKTELLLHKLIEIYTNNSDAKILFTCHNKILAENLKDRIPNFFTFMKVEQQIAWLERLWCVHAWGSRVDKNSGALRYICDFYDIPFQIYSSYVTFDVACQNALSEIQKKSGMTEKAFDYIIIDESQDFPKSFFELCTLVTKEKLYIAGDIFQSIFDDPEKDEIEADFLLNRCYRTDPKTLMFSHGLGMNLFENGKQLRWLEKKQWEECGYVIEDKETEYFLTREPVRRFEDIEDRNLGTKIQVINSNNDIDVIIDIIDKLKKKYETISPDDIAIIIMHEKYTSNNLYDLVKLLEIKIPEQFNGWHCNIAYETKKIVKNQVFVTNTNNIKGLEYPFVIVVCNSISDTYVARNSLYMSLTRSFLESYLVSYEDDIDKIQVIKSNLDYINRENKMKCVVPTIEHQQDIQMKLKKFNQEYNPMVYANELVSTLSDDISKLILPVLLKKIRDNPTIKEHDLNTTFKVLLDTMN